MKFGMRKPSLMKSYKARTTGRAKKTVKKVTHSWVWSLGNGMDKEP